MKHFICEQQRHRLELTGSLLTRGLFVYDTWKYTSHSLQPQIWRCWRRPTLTGSNLLPATQANSHSFDTVAEWPFARVVHPILPEHPPQNASGNMVISRLQIYKTHVDWLDIFPFALQQSSGDKELVYGSISGMKTELFFLSLRFNDQPDPLFQHPGVDLVLASLNSSQARVITSATALTMNHLAIQCQSAASRDQPCHVSLLLQPSG